MISPDFLQLKQSIDLSENDLAFISRIFKNGIEPYKNRLLQYKFQGYEKVLDAGCGFGQWSIALSSLNDLVYAYDSKKNRIAFIKTFCEKNKIKNIIPRNFAVDKILDEDNYFDAVFSYSVLPFTPWKEVLKELVRVLKPGGKIYINANGLGWYKNLWYNQPNTTTDYQPKKIAAMALLNTYKYQNNEKVTFPTDILVEPNELISECEKLGLLDIELDGEGLLGNPNNKNTFFQKEYFRDVGVFEIIAKKVAHDE